MGKNSLAGQLLSCPEQTALFFLGQAGFILKHKGTLLGIDLYLSDCCQRYYGYKRLMPRLLEPEEATLDILIATHAHEDHFDVDALPIMMKNGKTKLFAAKDAYRRAAELGLPMENVVCMVDGTCLEEADLKLRAVFCDHGPQTPDAVGLVVEAAGKLIYVAGDTALRLDKVPEILQYGPFDLMICPINGRFGNMNEEDAVTLCEHIRPACVIPCHYWNFAEHGGDPGKFAEEMKRRLPNQSFRVMAMGEKLVLEG